MLKTSIAGLTAATAESAIASEKSPPIRWVLASLSLSILLSSLGTSIANVGLPTLAQEFGATLDRKSVV